MSMTVHVRVRVGGEQYALPVEHVHEVLDLGEVTPVPGAPDSVLGLRNLGGEIVPTFDLAKILQIEGDGHRPEIGRQRLLITEHEGRRGGFAVDEVLDVGGLPGAAQEPDSPCLLASTVIDGALVGVLAVESLFDSITSEEDAR
jgi:purine-binding chemotaxis protein CheW